MRILVYPHDLNMGGSQLNAIEIAAGVHRAGHETAIVGRPGALVERIEELGLEFVELPAPHRRPSRRVAQSLAALVDARGVDVIHGYEWPPTLEARWAALLRPRISVVSTVMSMAVAPFIPKSIAMLVGTEQIAAAEEEFGRHRVSVLEPPVDLRHNDPGLDLGQEDFRRRWGIDSSATTIVVVTRLAHQLKLEGLLTAMRVVGGLRSELGTRLVIVGDGPARAEVDAAAAAANSEFGAQTVTLTGELFDPRAAYACADLTLGMGGSALRAMAYGKPLVVQGEQGFWKLLAPESVDEFLWAGWFGHGSGVEHGEGALRDVLRTALGDRARLAELGTFARDLVERRFSLDHAVDLQVRSYEAARSDRVGRGSGLVSDVAGGGRYVAYYVGKRIKRARGVHTADDFNARPVKDRRPEPVTSGSG